MLVWLVALSTFAYLVAAYRQSRAGRRWSRWRTLAFVSGGLLLGVAMAAPVMQWAHHDLRGHMAQHLVVGMLVPLAWVLAAPVTLVLRTLPVAMARRCVGLLHALPMRLVTHPLSALMLNIGGMYVLYLTPLYAITLRMPWLHEWMLVHFLLAGYLFCWAILAAPDASPHALCLRYRAVVLYVSMAAHAILGKLMYGHAWPRDTHHGIEEIQAAAQVMYYGGDAAEALLALAFFVLWYRRSRRPPSGVVMH